MKSIEDHIEYDKKIADDPQANPAARRHAKRTGSKVKYGMGSKGGGGNELSGNKPRASNRQPSASRRKPGY